MAGLLSGQVDPRHSITLLDVVPLSLGTACVKDKNSRIIMRNTAIPYMNTKTYRTVRDNQTEVLIEVTQGENK